MQDLSTAVKLKVAGAYLYISTLVTEWAVLPTLGRARRGDEALTGHSHSHSQCLTLQTVNTEPKFIKYNSTFPHQFLLLS